MVAWSSIPRLGGTARLGLRLELAASPSAVRHAFADWIAVRTAAARAAARRHPGPGGGRRR
jgi:hypothetical protein